MTRWLACLLSVALVSLAACERREPRAAGTLPVQVVSERIASGLLRRHIVQAPDSLDPSLRNNLSSVIVCDDLFEGLIRLAPDGSLVAGVAQSWEYSADGLRWTFHLRPDARWSNGDPVTAQDFIYAWRRVVSPATASPGAQQLAPIVGATEVAAGLKPPDALGARAIDAQTLQVQLATPTPYFLYLLTGSYLFPLHRATLEMHGMGWTNAGNLVGNGAYMLVARAINGPIELQRNPRYWDAAAVKLPRVTYLPLPDNTAATSRFLAGGLDMTDSFQIDDLDWLRRDLKSAVRVAPAFFSVMLGMNTRRAPFDNRALRRALSMSIDREILTQKLLKGLRLPAYGLVPPLPGYTQPLPDWARWPDAKRHEQARQLYAEAGYSKQHPLVVDLTFPTTNRDTRRVLEALAAMWRTNLGANVRLANQEFRVYLQNRRIGALGLFWYDWAGDYPDPLTFLELPLTGSANNAMQYDNPRYNAAVAAAVGMTEPVDRYARYAEAERMLSEDAVVVPVYYYQSRHLLRDYLGGWQDNAMDRHLSRDLYLAQPGSG